MRRKGDQCAKHEHTRTAVTLTYGFDLFCDHARNWNDVWIESIKDAIHLFQFLKTTLFCQNYQFWHLCARVVTGSITFKTAVDSPNNWIQAMFPLSCGFTKKNKNMCLSTHQFETLRRPAFAPSHQFPQRAPRQSKKKSAQLKHMT